MLGVVGPDEQVAFFRANCVGILLRERPLPDEPADSCDKARPEQSPAAGTILCRHTYAGHHNQDALARYAAYVVVSGFSRTVTVRLKADTTNKESR